MEEALYEITSIRQFARLTLSAPPPPRRHDDHEFPAPDGETPVGGRYPGTINAYLQDKGLSLRQDTIVDATIIHTQLDQEQGRQTRPGNAPDEEGNQYFFGMKGYIGADAKSGLVHHVHGTDATWLA